MVQENQKETYLELLEASLEKKCELLDELIECSKEQGVLFDEEKVNDDQFDQIIDKKDKRIQMILQLDEGFEKIYERVKDELSSNQTIYQSVIANLKTLVKSVTDKSIQLQAIEMRNKNKIDDYFRTKRKEIKNFKVNNQTATSYYKSRVDQYQQQSYFFDKKK